LLRNFPPPRTFELTFLIDCCQPEFKAIVSPKVAELAGKFGSKAGRFANALPFVGIGFGIWMVVEDAKMLANAKNTEETVHFAIDLGLDSIILALDFVNAAIPGFAAPLVLLLTVVRMFIDDFWDGISSEFHKLDCTGNSGIECFGKGVWAFTLGTLKVLYMRIGRGRLTKIPPGWVRVARPKSWGRGKRPFYHSWRLG
jgi:hypothetical protein